MKIKELDDRGMQNLMLAMIQQARRDYVKGYETMMNNWGRVLSYKEYKDWYYIYASKKQLRKVDKLRGILERYFSAVEFVEKDLYNIFDNQEDKILKAWKELAIKSYSEKLQQCKNAVG